MFIFILIIIILLNSNNFVYSKDIIKVNNDVYFKKATFDDLFGWENENYKEALNVFLDSCKKIMTFPNNYNIFPQINKKINKNDFYVVCRIGEIIKNYNYKYLQVFFENYFIPYEVIDVKTNNSLFTGYYLPQINAKKNKDNIFKYPIYRKPDNFDTIGKYYTREEINKGILKDKNLEILYTDDLIELFFLHIQGSGNVFLVDENKMISIGYDCKNKYNFTSIGKYMLKNNLISSQNMDTKSIKKKLKQNMALAEIILNKNKSYIFFKILENNNITGAFGTKLIPFRTIAVDKKYIPLGFPLWLTTKHTTQKEIFSFNKLVVANDTGSAIKGVVRGDIFFGSGIDGENNASFQYSNGKYYLLIPTKIVKKL